MYSRGDLNNNKLNLVCKVSDEETFEKLKRLCPSMSDYYEEGCDYYLTSRGGKGRFNSYNGSECLDNIPYKLISVLEIEGWFCYETFFEYDNGIPIVWGEL